MGYGMAGNVRKQMSSSGTLFLYDVVRDTCEAFAQDFKGFGPIEIIDAAKTGVDQSNTLITMVPDGANVQNVYLEGPGAVTKASRADRLILECSTIDVQTSRKVGEMVMQAGIGHYFDSPVSVSHLILWGLMKT